MKVFLSVVFCLATTTSFAQDRITLGQYRAKFVGQKVVINGSFSDVSVNFLSEWQFTKEKKGRYQAQYGSFVPTSFVGQTGTIIAVQAKDAGFGEPVPSESDDTLTTYAEGIIRTDSGKLLETAIYNLNTGASPSDPFTLGSTREKHRQEAAGLAAKLNGASLYFSRLTKLYDVGLTVGELPLAKAGNLVSEAQIIHFPLLTPIPVTDVKYAEQYDATLIEVKLPDGRKGVYVLGCVTEVPTEKEYHCASLSKPGFLTDREFAAIQSGSIYVGMSEPALYMTMGFPMKTNESIKGDNQLIYASSYVYTADHKVVEVQSRD